MRFLILAFYALAISAFTFPASAQSSLDRTDPVQAEDVEEADEISDLPTAESTATVAPAPGADGIKSSYLVSAIIIDGRSALPVAVFADIVERYSGRDLSPGQLEALVNEIANRARARGYVFATAVIEPQPLSVGLLRIRLDEGIIDEIRIRGDDDPAIRRQLVPLQSGRPVTLAMLERQILLAGDISGSFIRRSYYERENGRGILVVEAYRSKSDGYVELENNGSQPIGPIRARFDLDLNGVVSPTDEIDLTYSTTPLQPKELQYGRVGYRMVVNNSGTEIGGTLSYSATDPGAYLADRDVFGKSWQVGFEARHPFIRSRNASLWGEFALQMRDLRQEREGAVARHDRIPVVRVGLFSIAEAAGGRFRGRLTYSQGMSIFDATELGDPLASRDDASAEFSSLYGWADWSRDLPSDFSIRLVARGQLTTAPLLSTEDLGLGGNSFLRGYNYSERFGDEGIMGSAELRYDWDNAGGVVRRLQVYAYVDGGLVGSLGEGRGDGSLASAGGGFRANLTRNLYFDAEVAVPLTGPRYDTGDKAPRFNLRLRYRS
ncbi:ShlB/FhaC/HecB family hemolysin secretion/activation protein [Roseibium sp.]|uniref:ShlB/FhaC/HecB family hemolysin secretion/activation protein n=1 Tax=Roseibium sp. TaxID=1936156 RepID=UPI0032985D46